DLRQVTGGETNERLARLTIQNSAELGDWMPANGVRWQKPLRGTLHLARSNLFVLGGGKAMMNAYYDTASQLGVATCHKSQLSQHKIRDRDFGSALPFCNGASSDVHPKPIVLPARRFEANIPFLKEYWGDAPDNFISRRTKHTQGRMLKE